MSEEFYDEDGFRLTFEDETPDQEKQFFMRAFPNVNKISDRKVHCTSCYMHIGTAPISEAVIRMHPVLRVTHCRNCHTFYNSGEFDKGEDGSELYCRWCGQGGEVYCCSKCPYVFCKKCIVQNLSRACVQDISRNDNWQCFSCAPKIMWHLRAQHWALSNYIEKQKKDMKDKNLSVQAINNMMKQDSTTCCTNKGLNKKATTPVAAKKQGQKRASDAAELPMLGTAKIPDKRPAPRPMGMQQPSAATPPAAKKQKTGADSEVVCTPDIMSMFMNPEEPPPLVAARPAAPAAAPKQVVPAGAPVQVQNRQVVVRPAAPNAVNPVPMRLPVGNSNANAVPPPVYHTINGYRIDLHTAAQQGTYRLPNGKLIQVRKQAPTASPPVTSVPARNVTIAPKPTTVMYNPASMAQNPAANRMSNGGGNAHLNYAIQQQQQLQEQRLQQQRQQQMLQQQRQQPQVTIQPGQPQPTIVAGQINPALQLPTLALLQGMVNGPHEDSPLGRSRKNFEGKLLSGVEICQHIVNKINTLTNSNSFKNIRNVRDLKELYIHVSYLLTYAIGRFKTLQEKCVDDVKKMGFTKESDFVMMGEQISNRNPEEDKSDDEDDCEIIEQNTTLITIDSEDEEDASKKQKKKDSAETEAAVATILDDKEDEANESGEPMSMEDFLQVSIGEADQSTEKKDEGETVADSSTEEKTEAATAPKKDEEDMVELIEVRGEEDVAELSEKKQESGDGEAKKEEGKDDAAKVEEKPESSEAEAKSDGEAKKEEQKDEAEQVEDKSESSEVGAESKSDEKTDEEVKMDEAETEKTAESTEKNDESVEATTEESTKDETDADKPTEPAEAMEQEDKESKADEAEEQKKDESVDEKPAEAMEQEQSAEPADVEQKDDEVDTPTESVEPEPSAKTVEEEQKEDAIDKPVEVMEQQDEANAEIAESGETVQESSEEVNEAETSDEKESAEDQPEPTSESKSPETVDKEPEQETSEVVADEAKSEEPADEEVKSSEPESAETVEAESTEPKEQQPQVDDSVLVSSSESVDEKSPEKDVMDVDAASSDIIEAESIPTEVKEGATETEESSTTVEDTAEAIPETDSVETSEPTVESKPSEVITVTDSAPSQVQDLPSEDPVPLEPEAPSPTALFAQMEDSLQKVQAIFESTSEAVDEEEESTEQQQQKISYADDGEDAEMTEAETAPLQTVADEQMEVDGEEAAEAATTPTEAVTSEEPLEAPAGTVDATASESVAKDDGLEEIDSAENFSQGSEEAKKVEQSEGTPAEVNGDC